RLFTEAALRLAKLHPEMTVAAVPSNHGRWRRGKGNLGRPGDDYGIEILTQVADAFALNPEALGHVKFVVPEVWDETIALDIHGTILAVSHGHQATNPDRIPQWWANQDRKSTRLNSSHVKTSYAVFCLKKNTQEQGFR